MHRNNFNSLIHNVIRFLKIYGIGLLIFFIFRTLLLISFSNPNDISGSISDLIYAYWLGVRFDTMILLYALFPVFALFLAGSFLQSKVQKILIYIAHCYIVAVYSLLFILLTVDFYYFSFFGAHFNLLVFGFIDDDTTAVLTSMFTDYPFIRLILLFVVIIFIIRWLSKKVLYKNYTKKYRIATKIIAIVVFLFFYFVGMRGTLRLFPIGMKDATFAANKFINQLAPNGIIALKEAFTDRQKSKVDTDIKTMLKTNGFDSIEQAATLWIGNETNKDKNICKRLYNRTKTNQFLSENKPNVIVFLVESWSNYFLTLHSDSLNLLGELENQLPHCMLFSNFLSSTDGTIHSLESLIANAPITTISQSEYFAHSFQTSSVLPFKEAGYRTGFYTSGEIGWRNIGQFLQNQYFDVVEGNTDIMRNLDEATSAVWGVYDEFLFEYVFNELTLVQNHNEPFFAFGLTITNHTPYEVSSEYKKYPLNISDSLQKTISNSPELTYKSFLTYQYTNNCIGQFIRKIRQSKYAENTILVFTGDHGKRRFFNFSGNRLLDINSVPLLLYIPEKYQPKHNIDFDVFASHKDIFPTVFNIALSDAKYVNSGNNLFDTIPKHPYFALNHYLAIAIDKYGAVDFDKKIQYYKWQDKNFSHLIPVSDSHAGELKKLLLQSKSYITTMSYLEQKEMISSKQKENRK